MVLIARYIIKISGSLSEHEQQKLEQCLEEIDFEELVMTAVHGNQNIDRVLINKIDICVDEE